MRLKCCLVRRKLAASPPSGALPKSTAAHLAKCEACAAEARAYARLGRMLADERGKSNTPDWGSLRLRLPERKSDGRPRPAMLPIGATVLAAVALVLTVWPRIAPMSVKPSAPVRVAVDQPKPVTTPPRRQPDVKPNQPKTKPIIESRSSRVQRFRRYKPWKLTAQAPKQTHGAQPAQHVVAASTNSSDAPQSSAAPIDYATAADAVQDDGSKYVIDMVSTDDVDYAPL